MTASRDRHDGTLLAQSRALGDPTRFAIFRYLDHAISPVGVAELTGHFGLNHNAVRQHLAKLREAGLVIEEQAPPSGPGRPSLRYRTTPGVTDRWQGTTPYETLALLLLDLLRGGTPREVGHAAGRRLADEFQPRAGDGHDGGAVQALEALEALARRMGFEPRSEARAGRVDIILDRCPFASTAETAPEIICELHRGLAEGIIEQIGAPVSVADLVIRPPRRAGCRLKLDLVPG